LNDYQAEMDNPIIGVDPNGTELVHNGLYDAHNQSLKQIYCDLRKQKYTFSFDTFVERVHIIMPDLTTDQPLTQLVPWAVPINDVYNVWDVDHQKFAPILVPQDATGPSTPPTTSPTPPGPTPPSMPVSNNSWPTGVPRPYDPWNITPEQSKAFVAEITEDPAYKVFHRADAVGFLIIGEVTGTAFEVCIDGPARVLGHFTGNPVTTPTAWEAAWKAYKDYRDLKE
jgi:hypothetical protein